MLRFIIGLLLSLAPLIGHAACSKTGCNNVYIDTLYINASGVIYIGTSGDENALSCSAVSNVYATLDINEPGASAIYSALLTAQTSDKLVQVRTVDNSPNCKVLYVVLNRQ